MRKNLKYIIIFLVCLTVLIFIKLTAPEEIDWSPSFSKNDKIAFGNFILFNLLPEIFPDSKVTTVNTPIYNHLNDAYYYNSNYIFINEDFFPDELDMERLLNYAEEGNSIFIAAASYGNKFLDTLELKLSFEFKFDDTSFINFTDESIKKEESYKFKHINFNSYFISYDTSKVHILGKNKNGFANFLMIPFGKGEIYLNSVPYVFTNYNLLEKGSSDYIFSALSYLPLRDTFWDEYYKSNKKFIDTPLRFILSEESLRWAYYILILSIILFIIFEGKRKQRIIPVIKPLANTTVGFVKTIGKLYYEQKDHKNIAEKRITYFMDFLRTRYFIKTNEFNEENYKKISEKSGVDIMKVRHTFNTIKWISSQKNIEEYDLLELNNQLINFYKKSG
ncbi:MAG TPA: DUF4350 domain-containing protein [Ignavibacteriaceae bacterium]|nr:DUF4350 domain-containing protein [Ignavibacteriaceae bacterium]